ncbi:protein kinase domain-containing protein [Microbacterium sp. RG1]|uniref:protein kinase domain-containing protein n=1 Tax=Microbacterium sp. RG1 TaxID=2489212 RepID=UPI001EE182CE|nr:protein kinase [Microbacterium sp. RG1]
MLLAGRFRLRSLLGSGGTASVFAADDTRTGERVALKLLHPHLAEDPARWEAFFEEVNAARAVDHENIARVLDAGVADDGTTVVWIAMELAQGVTLIDHVRERGPLEPSRARDVADRVLAALSAAHAQSVVHRDVTPANIMIEPDASDADFGRSVTLLDFGLADVPGRPTVGADALLSGAEGAVEGVVASVAYASPEQLGGAPVTEASDLYQVGAVLFFMLTARPPYAGDAAEIARAHLAAPPPLPSARRRGVPRALDRVVATAMLKDPADRYPDAEWMRAALASPPVAEVSDAVTAPTRHYRTVVPASTDGTVAVHARAAAQPVSTPLRGRWPLWTAAVAATSCVVAVIAVSAAAGSAPSAVPSRPAPTAVALAGPEPTVTETTSPPPTTVLVPQLAGLTLTDAARVLESAGLRVGDLVRVDAAAAADVVLGAEPAEGSAGELGSSVSLRVATGNNAVPPVTGMTLADAEAAVVAAGFRPGTEYSGRGAGGVALAIWPAAGELLPFGSAVTLVAARPEPSPTPVPTPTPTPSPSMSTSPTLAPPLP